MGAQYRDRNGFTSYYRYTSITKKQMSNRSGNMIITSKLDETGKVCSIWTKCDCVYFFDIEALFWCNGTASLVVSAWSFTHQQDVNNKMNNHILLTCYTIQLIHQIIKCSSCSLEDLPSILWLMMRIRHIHKFFWYN